MVYWVSKEKSAQEGFEKFYKQILFVTTEYKKDKCFFQTSKKQTFFFSA
jgi:hypothetical protein